MMVRTRYTKAMYIFGEIILPECPICNSALVPANGCTQFFTYGFNHLLKFSAEPKLLPPAITILASDNRGNLEDNLICFYMNSYPYLGSKWLQPHTTR